MNVNFIQNTFSLLMVIALTGCMTVRQALDLELPPAKPASVICEVPPPFVAIAAPANKPITTSTLKPAITATTSNWIWPAETRVATQFDGKSVKGINFHGSAGDSVYAVADGIVVFAGTGFNYPGKFIIIKHDNVFLTAYANNRKSLVKENDKVTQGQKIAEMGNSVNKATKLYFEVRKLGKPVDPSNYLPSR